MGSPETSVAPAPAAFFSSAAVAGPGSPARRAVPGSGPATKSSVRDARGAPAAPSGLNSRRSLTSLHSLDPRSPLHPPPLPPLPPLPFDSNLSGVAFSGDSIEISYDVSTCETPPPPESAEASEGASDLARTTGSARRFDARARRRPRIPASRRRVASMSGTNAGVELISRASTRRARLRYCRRAEGNRTQSLRILETLENQHLVAGSRPRPPRGVFSSSRRVFEPWLANITSGHPLLSGVTIAANAGSLAASLPRKE